MPTSFRAESHGHIVPGQPFAEIGVVIHNDKEFTSGGAYIDDERIVAYLNNPDETVHVRPGLPARPLTGVETYLSGFYPLKTATSGAVVTWGGQEIGRYVIIKSWTTRTHYGSYDMCQVTVRLNDGRSYQGRSQGPGMVFKGARIAAQRKAGL